MVNLHVELLQPGLTRRGSWCEAAYYKVPKVLESVIAQSRWSPDGFQFCFCYDITAQDVAKMNSLAIIVSLPNSACASFGIKEPPPKKSKMKTDKHGHIECHSEVFIFPPSQINCMQPPNRFWWCFYKRQPTMNE